MVNFNPIDLEYIIMGQYDLENTTERFTRSKKIYRIGWSLKFCGTVNCYCKIPCAPGNDRLPSLADRPQLSYTEAVLHESMRLATVAPSGVWHETLCDTSIGRCHFVIHSHNAFIRLNLMKFVLKSIMRQCILSLTKTTHFKMTLSS